MNNVSDYLKGFIKQQFKVKLIEYKRVILKRGAQCQTFIIQ